jgi:inosose dehydratase
MIQLLDECNYDDWITVELDSYEDPKKGQRLVVTFYQGVK